MTLGRIASGLAAAVLAAVLAGSTYGAHAARPSTPSGRGHEPHRGATYPFQAPVVHRYGSNGMRLGLHCETRDMS